MAATGNPDVKFCTAYPPFTTPEPRWGNRSPEFTGMSDGLEVTDEVFSSPANIALR